MFWELSKWSAFYRVAEAILSTHYAKNKHLLMEKKEDKNVYLFSIPAEQITTGFNGLQQDLLIA